MKDRILANTEPKEVFHYFEDLTCIPRESGNEAAVCAYLVEFAKAHGLEYQTDDAHNIIMRRSAGKGFEDRAGVILQAHMDMVCEKNAGVEHDFAKDPIPFEIEGDKIIARDTTLGADDGHWRGPGSGDTGGQKPGISRAGICLYGGRGAGYDRCGGI